MTGSPGSLLLEPPGATALLVLAHGAGAGMRHAFMEGVAQALYRKGVATWRYQFGYKAAGRRLPPRGADLAPEVGRAVAEARAACPHLALFAGGKSLGGRMTSTAASVGILPGVGGLVFLGFPLHPAGKPGVARAAHLERVPLPMLFLQGDRDPLSRLDLLMPVVAALGSRAMLRVIPGADHGFHVPKRSGRTDADVVEELARVAAEWMEARTGDAVPARVTL